MYHLPVLLISIKNPRGRPDDRLRESYDLIEYIQAPQIQLCSIPAVGHAGPPGQFPHGNAVCGNAGIHLLRERARRVRAEPAFRAEAAPAGADDKAMMAAALHFGLHAHFHFIMRLFGFQDAGPV